MKRSYTIILMASLSLITTEAAHMIYAQNCGKDEYNRCIALADPLVKDPHFIYPGNLKDIDNICRTWTLFVDCTKRYTEHCFEESKRKVFNKAVENSIELVHQMCTSPQYQTEYLKHASCLRTTLFDDSRCGKHYRSLAGFISNETSGPSICCTHHRFRECVLDQTRRTCNQDDDSFTQQLLDKAFGFFRNQCIDYVPNQDECPGYEYYNAMTTNRWQDDKGKGSPSPSQWPSTKRQDDWRPEQNTGGWSGGPSTAPAGSERTSRGHTVQVYILSPTGQCIYRGQSSSLISYLSSVGLQCPLHHNPADFVIEVSSGEYGDHNETLVKYINNGKSNDWNNAKSIENSVQMQSHRSNYSRHKCISKFFNELRILISRTLIISSRDSDFIRVRIFVPLLMSFLFGSVYLNIGKSGSFTRDNVIMLYFSMMAIVYLSAYSMSISKFKN